MGGEAELADPAIVSGQEGVGAPWDCAQLGPSLLKVGGGVFLVSQYRPENSQQGKVAVHLWLGNRRQGSGEGG